MSTQVQRRKGTTVQHSTFTGASAELTVDTTKNTVVVHDGATAGGIPLAKETGSTISATAITGPFNGSVGATTPSTGAFTTVTTTSTINGISVGKGGVDANGSALNTAIGNDALRIISSTRSGNVAVGASALHSSTNGRDNVAVGFGALFTNPLNSYNVAVGASALFSAEGSFNTAVGRAAGSEMSTGSKNTIIGNFNGFQAGLDIRTSDNFIVLSDGDGTPRAYWNGANPTFPGALTLSEGTANGVTYLNGSKVLTSGTALTFDGTTLSSNATTASPFYGTANAGYALFDGATNSSGARINISGGDATSGINIWGYNAARNGYTPLNYGASEHIFKIGADELMRLTSSGLEVKQSQLIGYSSYSGLGSYGLAVAGNVGIGTSSPAAKLTVVGPMWVPASPFKSVVDLYSTDAQAADVGAGITLGGVYDSSNNRTTFAQIAGIKENATSGNFAGALALYTRVNGAGLVERMRLDSSGNLGLGVTPSAWNTAYKGFQIGASAALYAHGGVTSMHVTNNSYEDSGGVKYKITGAAADYQQSGGTHYWYTAPSGTAGNAISFTQAMTLDASGNLLVGTTTHVNGAQNNNSFDYSPQLQCATINHINGTPSTYTYLNFGYNTSVIGSIAQNGTTGVLYNTSSDYRLKNITGPITTSGAYIDSLKPVEGTWKADGSTFVGLIAHETQEASRTTVATGTKDGEQMQGMDYSSAEIIANLIAELQSLRARVASLESK